MVVAFQSVKLLLTSAGVQNPTIEAALVELLGKPVAECSALAVPTGAYASPYGSPAGVWRFVAGRSQQPMTDLGWGSVGVFELTALPGIPRERWVRWLEEADALLVNGGEAAYLAHWMRESGLADLLPSLDLVYVGFSAGSMALAPRVGAEFVDWEGAPDDTALGLVDFALFPHVDHPDLDENTMAEAEKWAARLDCPAYAIDDDTAIQVVDGEVTVVSQGSWRFFPR